MDGRIGMKQKRTTLTIFLIIITIVLLGSIFYISSLLASPTSPTQIQKTKASAVTYSRTVALAPFGNPTTAPQTTVVPTRLPTLAIITPLAALKPTALPTLKPIPTILPSILPTILSTIAPTKIPVQSQIEPTDIPEPTSLPISPTLQPLLAYKSTSLTPTLIPLKETGGMTNPTKVPTVAAAKQESTKGSQTLPETGWIQTSSILFIVATSTILFSLLF